MSDRVEAIHLVHPATRCSGVARDGRRCRRQGIRLAPAGWRCLCHRRQPASLDPARVEAAHRAAVEASDRIRAKLAALREALAALREARAARRAGQ